MKEFAKKLAEFLALRKGNYTEVETRQDGYCDTCYHEWHEVEIDAEALERDIDEFIAEFEAKRAAEVEA